MVFWRYIGFSPPCQKNVAIFHGYLTHASTSATRSEESNLCATQTDVIVLFLLLRCMKLMSDVHDILPRFTLPTHLHTHHMYLVVEDESVSITLSEIIKDGCGEGNRD